MYQSFIGLEIHIHLLADTKVFCGCKAAFGDKPNTNICPVCMGYPGVLPVLNEKAVSMAYMVCMALNCKLNEKAVFERKNYYYPDLPKNYQITQFEYPSGIDGYMDIKIGGEKKRIRIHDVHLEEDAGKMIHGGGKSRIDYNRTGTPLLEIVTEPDFEKGEEAEIFIQDFRRLVRYLGVCDGNMEEGSLRCDANVSVNLRGKGLGRKAEVKNLNSSRFVRKALDYEIIRQKKVLSAGETVVQETRLWNEARSLTESMRSKEEAHDYRYFPEPDLPPFYPGKDFLESVKALLVELPARRKERFLREYNLSDAQADFLCEEKTTADYFEETIKAGADPVKAALWLSSDVKKILNREKIGLSGSPLSPGRLAELISLINENRISGKIAKEVLEIVFKEDKNPVEIIKECGMEQVADKGELEAIVKKVMDDNPHVVESIKNGAEKQIGFLMGQIMKATGGKADPALAQKIIREKI